VNVKLAGMERAKQQQKKLRVSKKMGSDYKIITTQIGAILLHKKNN